MTSAVFTDWVCQLDQQMARKHRKIALVLDNCSSHPKYSADNLAHVKLVFLPPNLTSLIQPCDMGIIKNLKTYFRKHVIAQVVSVLDGNGDSKTVNNIAKSTSLLDAMQMPKVS